MFRRRDTREPKRSHRSRRETRGVAILGSILVVLALSGAVEFARSLHERTACADAPQAPSVAADESTGQAPFPPKVEADARARHRRADTAVLARLRRSGSELSPAQAAELATAIVTEAARHRFEPALVMAVIHVESSGRPTAVSPVGALGLMQIMPPTGEELAALHGIPWEGPNTLLDPIINVKLGVAYLRELTDRYQDMATALAAYNWGPGRIDRRLRAGESLPTLYRDRVMKAYDSTKQEIAVGSS